MKTLKYLKAVLITAALVLPVELLASNAPGWAWEGGPFDGGHWGWWGRFLDFLPII